LGTLAGEATAVIDAMVEQEFDRCVTVDSRGTVEIALDRLAGKTPYLLRELLMAVWRRRAWPMQAMSMAKWDELAAMAMSPAAARRDFPGEIAVAVADGVMRMQRH
ncbi:MAG: hypothetical protein ABFC96_03530, partial [Thermoguttaceae bacterium]